MQPSGELVIKTYDVPASSLMRWMELDVDTRKPGRITDAIVMETAEGTVVQIEVALDKE